MKNPSTLVARASLRAHAAPVRRDPAQPRADCLTRAKLYRASLKAGVRKPAR